MAKLNIGVIGLGNRGSKFGKNVIMQNPKASLLAVCDKDKNRHSFFKDDDVLIYEDYEDLIKNPLIDAVMIATPDNSHLDICKEAIKYHKHILCEKPLEATYDRAREINELLKGYDKTFLVGYVLRYAPLYERAKKLISDGTIGNVILANVIDNISYGGYAFFHDWHRKSETIYSLLTQKASHSIDVINWIINDMPKDIVAFGGLNVFGENGLGKSFNDKITNETRCKTCDHNYDCVESLVNRKIVKNINWNDNWPDYCVYAPEIDVDDNQTVMIKYENGAKANYTLCEFAPDYKRQFVFIGTKGKLEFDDKSNVITITYRENNNVDTFNINTNNLVHSGGDIGLLNDFIECCNTGKEPVANIKSSFISYLTCLRAQESIYKNQVVHL